MDNFSSFASEVQTKTKSSQLAYFVVKLFYMDMAGP